LEGQVDKLNLIVSFTFIEGQLSENKILNKKDDNYLGRLATQGAEEAYRAINGIWENKESSFGLVSYEDFENMFDNNNQGGVGFRCASADVALSGDYFEMFAFEDKHVVDWEAFTNVKSNDAIMLVRKFLDKNSIREENFTYDGNGIGLFLEGFFKKSKKFLSSNNDLLQSLIIKYNLHAAYPFFFVAGTIFCCKWKPVQQFFTNNPPLKIRALLEKGNVQDTDNGTFTHSWERLFSWIITSQGYTIKGL